MSQTQFVFFKRAKLHNTKDLQASICRQNFDLVLNHNFDLFHDQGFYPCMLNGANGMGFELFFQSTHSFLNENYNPDIKQLIGSNDALLGLSWGGSFKDCACVMMVCAALVKDFDATVSYECDDSESLESLLAGVDFCLKQIAEGKS